MLKKEETPHQSPWWLTLLQAADGGPDRRRAGAADLESARKTADRRRGAGAGHRQWLGQRTGLGTTRRHGQAADRGCQCGRYAGAARVYRRKAQCRHRPVRRCGRTGQAERRRASPGAGRPAGRLCTGRGGTPCIAGRLDRSARRRPCRARRRGGLCHASRREPGKGPVGRPGQPRHGRPHRRRERGLGLHAVGDTRARRSGAATGHGGRVRRQGTPHRRCDDCLWRRRHEGQRRDDRAVRTAQ